MADPYNDLSDEVKGIIDREGVPRTNTHPFDMDNHEFAEWLAAVIGRARGAELTADRRAELRSIVEDERDAIDQWLLTCLVGVLE